MALEIFHILYEEGAHSSLNGLRFVFKKTFDLGIRFAIALFRMLK